MNDHATNKDLYRMWHVDKKTGKRVYFSLSDRITFLTKNGNETERVRVRREKKRGSDIEIYIYIHIYIYIY